MADIIFNSYKADLLNSNIDHVADTVKVMLVTSTYTPDQDLHDFKDDVTNEVTGTGYTAGGASLASKTVTQDNTDNEGVFDAADLTWSASTITARGAVMYKSTGVDATSPLMVFFDFVTDQSSSAGDFTLQWGSEGIVNLT